MRNDFISRRLAYELKLPIREANTLVCTGLNNQCSGAIGTVTVRLQFHNEILRVQEIIELDLLVINHDIDIIIGKVSTRRHDLLKKLDNQIWSCVDALILEQATSNATAELLDCINHPEDATSIPSFVHATFSKDLYFDREDVQKQLDIETILDDFDLNLPVEDDSVSAQEEDVIPKQIFGDANLQQRIRELCRKFKRIFSRSIRKEPVKVNPMTIEIDLGKFEAASPPRGGRKMAIEKQWAIEEFIMKLKDAGVIRSSRASKYSYPTLTRKSNGTWRLCIDFRWLNEMCTMDSFTLPHISNILNRIGSTNPALFGVMNFTQGFYQALLEDASR